MTISAGDKVSYDGDGATIAFPVPFVFWVDDDIKVIHRDANGVETDWVKGTQYTLTGGDGSTGTVTAITSPTDYTPQNSEKLIIKSDRAVTQEQGLPLGGELPSTTVEQMIDQAVRLIQQQAEALSRSIKFSETSPDSDVAFPDVTSNPSRVLATNSGATALELVTLASLSLSGLDTLITSEAEDNFLLWNAVSSKWENETIASVRTALDLARLGAVNTFTATQGWAQGADIASATPLVLGTDGNAFDVTGTTQIDDITVPAGTWFALQFDGILQLTHGASLVLPGGANITTAAGDMLIGYAFAANSVRAFYQRADGRSVVADAGLNVTAGTAVTQDPYAANVTLGPTAHTLGAEPTFYKVILECTTIDAGYAVGDRIVLDEQGGIGAGAKPLQIIPDATNLTVLMNQAGGTTVPHKTTRVNTILTFASWKLEITPYLVS